MELEDLRKEIDAIDDEITMLFKKRLSVVKSVGEKKKETGKVVNDPDRERNILLRVTDGATDTEKMYLKRVFENIFEISKAYQRSSIKNLSKVTEKIEEKLKELPKSFPVKAISCSGKYTAVESLKKSVYSLKVLNILLILSLISTFI